MGCINLFIKSSMCGIDGWMVLIRTVNRPTQSLFLLLRKSLYSFSKICNQERGRDLREGEDVVADIRWRAPDVRNRGQPPDLGRNYRPRRQRLGSELHLPCGSNFSLHLHLCFQILIYELAIYIYIYILRSGVLLLFTRLLLGLLVSLRFAWNTSDPESVLCL